MNIAAGLIPRSALITPKVEASKPMKGDSGQLPEQGGASASPAPPPDTTSPLKKGQKVQHADGRVGKVHFYDPERKRARLTMEDGSKMASVKRSDMQPMGDGGQHA